MEREQKINMKPRIRTCQNDCGGGVYLAKQEHSKRVLIQQHMMSHYRRLYSAKCDVDTSVPSHFKPRYKPQSRPLLSSLPIQNQLTVNDMKFLESLSSDIRKWCGGTGSRHCVMHCEENNCLENMTNRSTPTRLEKCKMKKTESKMEIKKSSVNFSVPSKLREMSVYHPPRKRITEKSSSKHCACCPSINSQHGNEVNKHVCLKNNEVNYNLNAEKVSIVMGIQKEKLQYLQFVQDITQDILNNEMFSNDDLEEICKNHIQLNRRKLEMDKMMEQIHILKKQLGINKESNSSSKTDNDYRLSNYVDISSSDSKVYEDISFDVENELRFYPFLQVHKSKESQSHDNLKRNFEDNKQIIVKEQQMCKRDESNIFNLLKCMGFDPNIIEEICMGMNEQDNMKSSSIHKNTSQSKLEVPDFSGPYEIGEFSGKSDTIHHDRCFCSCTSQNTSKVSDLNVINMNKAENILRKRDNAQQKESRNRYQAPTDKKVKNNPVTKLGKPHSQKKKVTSETSKLSSSGSDTVYDENDIPKTKTSFPTHVVNNEDLKKCSKNPDYQGSNKENYSAPVSVISSPVASDYSSMKDHEESVSEVYSVGEVSDEGRESASEVEEEIPDDISQTTTSSKISQLTEQFKTISVNVGSKLHAYNANISLRSKDRKSSFQQLSA